MIVVESLVHGCVIGVRAQPGARKNGIVGEHAGMLKVAVTAPADKGRANEALVETLADQLGVKRSQVELVAGATSRSKKFLVRDTTAAILERKFGELLKDR